MLNADTEVDLLNIQSVEKASPVREESEVNQLSYFNNTDFYRYIAAIMTHNKTKSTTTPHPPTPGCEASRVHEMPSRFLLAFPINSLPLLKNVFMP